MEQQSKKRNLELEDSATKGNEYVHGLQQQPNAYGQAATQKIQALECSHQALQEEKERIPENAHQQEQALRKRIAAMENRELERAHAKFEASIVPPLPSFNQHPASAQTAQFEPTDSPKQYPTPVPEVDSQAKPRQRSRPPVRGRARTPGPQSRSKA